MKHQFSVVTFLVLLVLFLIALFVSGCAEDQSAVRWREMWIDLAIAKRLKHYGCGNCGRTEGYSKESPRPIAKASPAKQVPAEKPSDQRLEALSRKVDELERAQIVNTQATNALINAGLQKIEKIQPTPTP